MKIRFHHSGWKAATALFVLLSAASLQADAPMNFYALSPCRVVDTRVANGELGSPDLTPGTRSFPIASGSCGIPSTALAYSVNVTAMPKTELGYLTLYATGQSRPSTSTLNAWFGGAVANSVIVPAGTNGSISVYTTDETDLLLDINGYYLPAAAGANGAQGPTGPQGPNGATGPAGPVGPQGPTGQTGAAGPVGLTFRNVWDNSVTYNGADAVFFNGSTYISAISNNVGSQPDINPTQWHILAQKGNTGATGPQGVQGLPGAPGAPGASGAQGAQGATGATGAAGPVVYSVSLTSPSGTNSRYNYNFVPINGLGATVVQTETGVRLASPMTCSSGSFTITRANGGSSDFVSAYLRVNNSYSSTLVGVSVTGNSTNTAAFGVGQITVGDLIDLSIQPATDTTTGSVYVTTRCNP